MKPRPKYEDTRANFDDIFLRCFLSRFCEGTTRFRGVAHHCIVSISFQVESEWKKHGNDSSGVFTSAFKSEILKKVQKAFNTKTISGEVNESVRRASMGHIKYGVL